MAKEVQKQKYSLKTGALKGLAFGVAVLVLQAAIALFEGTPPAWANASLVALVLGVLRLLLNFVSVTVPVAKHL